MNTYEPTPTNSTSRPQADVETNLQASNSGDIRPGVSGQEVVNNRVVDASTLGQTAGTATSDESSEAESDTPDDLGHRVGAGLAGPVDAAGVRRLPLRSTHEATVVESEDGILSTGVFEDSEYAGGRNQHKTEAELDLAKRIDSYVPKMKPEYWAVIEDFVRAAVADAEPDRWSVAQPWMSFVSQHVLWCWQSTGMDLDRDVIFDPNTISRYINQRTGITSQAKGTQRSVLLRVSFRLLGERGDAWEHRRYGNSKGSIPYTQDDFASIRAYMNSETTKYRRDNIRALVALGGGAGLQPRELLEVRASDVEVNDNGIFVQINGERARRVPLLVEWDDLMLATLAQAKDGDLLVLPDRVQRGKSVVSDFLCSCTGNGLRPHLQRLRSTWLLAHLNARTPFPALMKAAGLSGLASLDRYLRYVDPLPGETEDSLLRLAGVDK